MEKAPGRHGIECRKVTDASGAEALISEFGGHILSWKTADGRERLYLSRDAVFENGSAIRGGIPVIFPQFSDHGPFARHGFARKSKWSFDEKIGALVLRDSKASRADWPHRFELRLGLMLTAKSLEVSLSVENRDATPFAFAAALHSYIGTDDVTNITLTGLEESSFVDEVTRNQFPPCPVPLPFGNEVDRSYLGSGGNVVGVREADATTKIESENFPDTVIWNPGPEHGIDDLDDWRRFVCVEAAQVEMVSRLEPGAVWTGRQKITAAV